MEYALLAGSSEDGRPIFPQTFIPAQCTIPVLPLSSVLLTGVENGHQTIRTTACPMYFVFIVMQLQTVQIDSLSNLATV